MGRNGKERGGRIKAVVVVVGGGGGGGGGGIKTLEL